MPDYLPPHDCPLCPRLVAFREANRLAYPTFFNAPVPSFGKLDAEFLVVGLAPGLKGANQTGRPFTGDYAGIVLYSSLLKFGFAEGVYTPDLFIRHPGEGRDPRSYLWPAVDPGLRRDDGLQLLNCRITNAVRCVPQENKPETGEIKQCNTFLKRELAAMPKLKIILSLGLISHNAVLAATGHKAAHGKFTHGGIHKINGNLTLINSYHCSRYNINTGRLTQAMFDDVIKQVSGML